MDVLRLYLTLVPPAVIKGIILLAAIFEENKLYIDALTAYQQAIKLSPDIPAYQEAYQDFLIRSNLTN